MDKQPDTEIICKECGKAMRWTWMQASYGHGYSLVACSNAGRGLGDTGCFMFGFPFRPDEYEVKFDGGRTYRLARARKIAGAKIS